MACSQRSLGVPQEIKCSCTRLAMVLECPILWDQVLDRQAEVTTVARLPIFGATGFLMMFLVLVG